MIYTIYIVYSIYIIRVCIWKTHHLTNFTRFQLFNFLPLKRFVTVTHGGIISWCVVCSYVLYCTVIYRESIVFIVGGDGRSLRWWPFSTLGWPFIHFNCHHLGCRNNLIFSNFGIWPACWAHFMSHHELWPTSVRHPFYFTGILLSLSLDLCSRAPSQYEDSLFQVWGFPC